MKKLIVGRKECVSFNALSIFNINAKIDTGAYTSSIFCEEIYESDGCLYCKFFNSQSTNEYLVFECFDIKKVKSSNGITEIRYCINTEILVGGHIYNIDLTLTNRNEMKYPVLIGRKFLKGKFMVDVAKTNKLSN